jgi:hypothetical protein
MDMVYIFDRINSNLDKRFSPPPPFVRAIIITCTWSVRAICSQYPSYP